MKSFPTSVVHRTQLLLTLALTFLNLILLLVNIGAIDLPERVVKRQKTESAAGKIQEVKVGQETVVAGYKIKFTNPRYEFDEDSLMNTFKIDVALENLSFEPIIRLVANCDLVDSGEIVKEGVGVGIRAEEDHLDPGEKMNWVIVVPLEIDYTKKSQSFADDRNLPGGHVPLFPNRKVSSCSFTPTGSYDPNIAVKIRFE